MWFSDFVACVGTIPSSITEQIATYIRSADFLEDARYDRPEKTLKEGRLMLPIHNMQPVHTESYQLTQKLREVLYMRFPQTLVYRTEIAVVHPGSSVKWHRDRQKFHNVCHRVHIPITSSIGAKYYFRWPTDDKIYTAPMEVGKMYNFNNGVPHAVNNANVEGAVPRCNVIVDLIDIITLQRWTTDELRAMPAMDHLPEPMHSYIRSDPSYTATEVTDPEELQIARELKV